MASDWRLGGKTLTQMSHAERADFMKEWISISAQGQVALDGLAPEARILGERLWTTPMQALPSLMLALVRLVPPDRVDAVIVDLYHKDQMLSFEALADHLTSDPVLARWRAVLSESIASYQDGRYQVAVPALLGVLEGALVAATQSSARAKPIRVAMEEAALAARGVEHVAWESIASFTARLYNFQKFDGPPPDRLNRHWVLHGRSDAEWKQADALRLLQAIETLSCAQLSMRQDPRTWFYDKQLYDDLLALNPELGLGTAPRDGSASSAEAIAGQGIDASH